MSIHEYGFRWGPINVTRLCMSRKGDRINYVLGVHTKHHDIEVSVSGKGRTVRVWIDGKEATTG